MLRFHEARARLLALAKPVARERVALDDADGRVLVEDLFSTVDAPLHDTSAMDGYAVCAADIHDGSELAVASESRPGGAPATFVPGTACRIFTGGRVPDGADAVVMQEDVVREGDRVRFAKAPARGANVRRRGEDLASGALALAAGTRLTPTKLGLVASLDHAWAFVARRPHVTVLSTGDELRLPGSVGDARKTIAESGSITVRAMARRAGAHAVVHPMVGDTLDETTRAIEGALRASDLVVTIGGMSTGDFDLVRPVLAERGVTMDFWKVAIKPGKPLGVGTRGDAIVLGLPGNPAAAAITFALFGVPLLRALAGERAPVPEPSHARLGARIAHKPGRMELVRATFTRDGGALVATPLAQQSSGSVASVGQADGMVIVPEDAASLEAGATVEVLSFAELGA